LARLVPRSRLPLSPPLSRLPTPSYSSLNNPLFTPRNRPASANSQGSTTIQYLSEGRNKRTAKKNRPVSASSITLENPSRGLHTPGDLPVNRAIPGAVPGPLPGSLTLLPLPRKSRKLRKSRKTRKSRKSRKSRK
jgi:hypothetical protein